MLAVPGAGRPARRRSRGARGGALIPRIVAILGDPVSHSRSPAMHNAAFRAAGLDFVYVAHRVAPRDLREALDAVRTLEYAGLNVTVPHKERIVPLLDRLSPAARAIGAVNTVVRRGERLHGDNTDAGGFALALDDAGFRPKGRTALVLGAGGSARAVVHALAREGIARIVVLNRTASRAAALRDLLPKRPGVAFETGSLDEARDPEVVGAADLVVNCTSIGLDGRSLPPLDVSATRRDALVIDLVYGAKPTPLVREARRRRRRAEDGRGMLLRQAGLGFRLWTRREPPLEVMARALRSSASR